MSCIHRFWLACLSDVIDELQVVNPTYGHLDVLWVM
jgi:hypothetical protein